MGGEPFANLPIGNWERSFRSCRSFSGLRLLAASMSGGSARELLGVRDWEALAACRSGQAGSFCIPVHFAVIFGKEAANRSLKPAGGWIRVH